LVATNESSGNVYSHWGRAKRTKNFGGNFSRRQVPQDEWAKDCLELCARVREPAELVRELEKRHPEGWSLNLAEGFYQIVQRRGRDVFPYVMRHLRQVWGGWLTRGSYGKMADYAREQSWWDLWSALIRVCSGPNEFNKRGSLLLVDTKPGEAIDACWRWRERRVNGIGRDLALPRFTLDESRGIGNVRAYSRIASWALQAPCAAEHVGTNYSRLLDRFIEAATRK
jgi:hypothetical protein